MKKNTLYICIIFVSAYIDVQRGQDFQGDSDIDEH